MKYIYFNLLMLLFLLGSCQKEKHNNDLVVNQKLIDNIETNNRTLSENKHTLDSLFSLIKSNNSNGEQLIQIAAKAYNLELYEEYLLYSKEANQIAIRNNDSILTAKSLWYIGDYFDYKMKLDSAYIYYDRADQIYQALKSVDDIAKMEQYKSIVLFREGLYIEAENKALDALAILDNKPKSKLLYEIYSNLGNILDLNQQPNEALIYYSEAIHILEELYRKEEISEEELQLYKASCYNNIGTLYHTQKSYLNAETYFQYSNNILLELNLKHELYTIVLTNLGTLNTSLNRLDNAETLLNESLDISQKMSYKQSITANNFRLAELALKKKDTIKAIDYYKKTYILSSKNHANNTILKSLKALSITDKLESQKYINLYYSFNDSMNKLQISKRNKFARIKYESEKLEKNIINLKKENSQLLLIGAIAGVLVIITLFFVFYRNKLKRLQYIQQDQENKELIYKLFLEQEQLSQEVLTKERERISQELHDGIINSLFIIRLNLSHSENSTASTSILSEIEKVQDQVRLISHDLKNQEFIQQGFSEIMAQLIEKNNSEHQKFQFIISKNYHWGNISYEDKINIYRIVQEAIQNVIKHSKAKNCIISISKIDNGNKITITDDGIGFNYKTVRNSNGLKNINNRAKQLKATITITSTDNGTIIILTIPT